MRKYRFYTERTNLRPTSSVKLPDFEAAHIRKSLRLSKGDTVYLFNGEKEFKARIKLHTRDAVMVEIEEAIAEVNKDRTKIALYQGLSKAKSFEEIIEKVTELGVDAIVPVNTEYSVVKFEEHKREHKKDRWEKIIISACKQSERITIPEVFDVQNFQDAIKHASETHDVVLFFSTESVEKTPVTAALQSLPEHIRSIGIVIGTEGGFSPSEIDLAKKYENITFVSLTDTILRSETAAILAVGLVKLKI